MKILICVPSMDQVAAGFAQSLATLNKVGDCAISFVCGSLVYDSRNKLARQALEFGADYTVWFDSDMIFEPDTLKKLIEHLEKDDCDIISGLYFRRAVPFTPVLFKKLDLNGNHCQWSNYDDYPKDSLFSVEGIGFGCCAVKSEVLLAMTVKYKDFFSPINSVGEDLSFCWRARELGYRIACDSSIKCGHIGHMTVTESLFLANEEAKKHEGQS